LVAIFYLCSICWIVWQWNQIPYSKTESGGENLFVSIIIPCRNEEYSIEECLHSLNAQDYPRHNLEVIVVDDHSTDLTSAIVNDFYANFQLKLLRLSDVENGSLSGKKSAIEYAINQASGDYILCTDADCILPPRWIRFHVLNLKSVDYSTSGVILKIKNYNTWNAFQALDAAGFAIITAIGIYTKKYYMSNGANHAYGKKVFQKFKGYDKRYASGDDVFLIQKMADYKREISFIKNRDCLVSTFPENDLPSFVKQRLRWGTKNKQMKSMTMRLLMLSVYLMSLASMACIFLAITNGLFWVKIMLIILITKMISDYILLRTATVFTGQISLMKYFLPSQILHILYISIIGTASLFVRNYMWKGRRVK
jgi:cellulose synthase/poly-beta-1,6-N-acetylglucosamine synthase-like glycosyltransferase